MSIEILTPVLPESVSDGTIVSWNKKVGDAVQIDDILVEIETDKVVLEVPALSAGVLTEITVGEGAVVNSSQLLGRMDSAAAAGTSTTDTAAMSAAPVAASADTHAAMGAATQGDMMDLLTPVMPESVADGTVVSWNKRVGDTVQSDEVLVEIETDKVVLEVPSLSSGVLTEIIAAEGATVTSNELLGRIRTGAASSAESQQSQSQSQAPAMSAPAASDASSMSAAPAAGPAARKMMAENDLDRSQVSGSGKSGRILKEDVQAVVNNSAGSESPAPMTTAATPSPASSAMSASGERTDERVPMSRLRKRVAERLLDAKQSTAMLTTFNEVDMQPLMDMRKEYKELFEKQHQVKLGFMSLFVKASAIALQRFPEINAFIEGENIVYHNYCDIGIAVSSERGLVVPVLRNAEQMGLADVEKNIMTYAQKAQEGKLDMADLTGGTFTITNGGVFGSLLSTPIINMPQSAILGMHATQKRAVVVNDEIVIRPMMYVALSYDHRIVDGKGAVTFLKTIKELVENPVRIILDV